MTTQIVKLNTQKDNVPGFFRKLMEKIGVLKKACEVTVILRDIQQNKLTKNATNQSQQKMESYQNDLKQNQGVIINISNKLILPNISISKQSLPAKKTNQKERTSIMAKKGQKKQVVNQKSQFKQKTLEQEQQGQSLDSKFINNLKTLSNFHTTNNLSSNVPQKKAQQQQNHAANQSDSFMEQSQNESIFIVQNKLNEALKFIKNDQLYQLQNFLYQFKDKYQVLNDRVQIKWRLMMAYCKQNRKQFERASINYSQVLQIAKKSPKSMLIDIAEVYHRLGVCFSEIKQWNNGIIAFKDALNHYKISNNAQKYSECINNLGTLYLTAGYISDAQQCFLTSYYIKQAKFGNNYFKLISTLLNIFECNLLVRNYQQAQQVLNSATNLVKKMTGNDMILGGIFRRRGKLQFLQGKIKQAQQNYQKSNELLEKNFQYSLEYGELLNNIAILKLDQFKYHEAKDLFQRSVILINFYGHRESNSVKTIKNNLQLVSNLVNDFPQ